MSNDDMMDDMQGLAAHNQRQRTNQSIEGLRAELAFERFGVAQCPHCGGGIPKVGVDVCKGCRRDLIWYKNLVGRPGEEEQIRNRYRHNQEEIRRARGLLLEKKESKKQWVWLHIVITLLAGFSTCVTMGAFLEDVNSRYGSTPKHWYTKLHHSVPIWMPLLLLCIGFGSFFWLLNYYYIAKASRQNR
ncbi:MAG: hypothetical protein MK179_21790 [Pirellulaceae bacterium]|nr:hypothetical protein [Pirellulaceae bacterium]